MSNLINLTAVSIAFNKFNEIPRCMYKLTNLVHLYIEQEHLSEYTIKTISEKICNLQKLETLSLSNNAIKILPNFITKLCNLKELGLSYNGLVELPSSIGNMESLENLELDSNNLNNLPSSITQLINLQELDLFDNPNLILTIPQKEWITKLQSNEENCIAIDANLLDRDKDYINPLQKDETWRMIFSTEDNLDEDEIVF